MNIVCLSIYSDSLEFLSSVPWGFHYRFFCPYFVQLSTLFMMLIRFEKKLFFTRKCSILCLMTEQTVSSSIPCLLHCFISCSDRLWKFCQEPWSRWKVVGWGFVSLWNCYKCQHSSSNTEPAPVLLVWFLFVSWWWRMLCRTVQEQLTGRSRLHVFRRCTWVTAVAILERAHTTLLRALGADSWCSCWLNGGGNETGRGRWGSS